MNYLSVVSIHRTWPDQNRACWLYLLSHLRPFGHPHFSPLLHWLSFVSYVNEGNAHLSCSLNSSSSVTFKKGWPAAGDWIFLPVCGESCLSNSRRRVWASLFLAQFFLDTNSNFISCSFISVYFFFYLVEGSTIKSDNDHSFLLFPCIKWCSS